MQAARRSSDVAADVWAEAVDSLLLLLAPVAPHVTEELWAQRGHGYSVHQHSWPMWDEEVAKEESITLVVQINGKVRDRIDVPAGMSDEELKALALASERVVEWLNGRSPHKVIVVKGRLVNIVG